MSPVVAVATALKVLAGRVIEAVWLGTVPEPLVKVTVGVALATVIDSVDDPAGVAGGGRHAGVQSRRHPCLRR